MTGCIVTKKAWVKLFCAIISQWSNEDLSLKASTSNFDKTIKIFLPLGLCDIRPECRAELAGCHEMMIGMQLSRTAVISIHINLVCCGSNKVQLYLG